MAKILSVYNRLQAGDYENGNGGQEKGKSTYSVYPRNASITVERELYLNRCLLLGMSWQFLSLLNSVGSCLTSVKLGSEWAECTFLQVATAAHIQ